MWVAALTPPLALLVIMLPLRGLIPFLDSWRFVGQYQDWLEGRYSWSAFLTLHYDHPSAVGKAVYFAVLHWMNGEVGVLPILSWIFSAFIAVGVCLLARPLWRGNPLRGAVLMGSANLTIFSTAQRESWIWDFLFQNYIPGVCLIAGILVLSFGTFTTGRIAAAALLTVAAIYSFASGFLVGLLLSLLIWNGTSGRKVAARCLFLGAWLAFVGLVAWAAFSSGDEESFPSAELLAPSRPAMRLQFFLVLLGRMLGEGTVVEPQKLATVAGGVLMLVFVSCAAFLICRRRDRKLVTASLPWIICCLYGLGTAVLISLGRMQKSFNPALANRYVSLTLFFVFGTVLLAATILTHGDSATATVRWMRKGAVVFLTAFVIAHLLNWVQGYQTMKLWSLRMEQERAMLAFVRVLPPDPEWMSERKTRPSASRLAKDLADSGRLRHVTMVSDNRLSAFQQGAKVSAAWACLEKPLLLDDGRWQLRGRGGLSDSSVADLVLITAESTAEGEQIVALAAPLPADTFWERRKERRLHPEHFLGWTRTISPELLPKGPLTLRAYMLDSETQLVHPVDGIHRIKDDPESH
ncbi:hypothetical protein AYO49_00450 [Verrucomicrobiaceae bacterium SCGC AG-212-N21]|nr:hypothetical protein AYO49_00450 [Verrucomicrobiaceae bacterium SCGC AG-212-N21]